MFLSVP